MDASNDPRFSSMATAPMFTKFKKDNFKTKVDSRFAAVLKDERFVGQGKTDIYGRKQNKKAARKEMESLYAAEDTESEVIQTSKDKVTKGGKKSKPAPPVGDKDARLEYLNKVARGEIDVSDSSDSDDHGSDSESDSSANEDSDSDSDLDAEDEDNNVTESALAIPEVGDQQEVMGQDENVVTSNRVAVKNCDWESVSAKDMLAIMQSFCPTGASVKDVTVYFSDFGMERMAQEEQFGPQGLWVTEASDSGSDSDSDSGSDSDSDSASGSEEDEEEEDEEEDDEDEKEKGFKGDIKRRKGQVGIVWEEEDEEDEEEDEEEQSGSESDEGSASDSDGDDSPAEYQGERNAFRNNGKGKGKNYSGSRTWQKPSRDVDDDAPKRVPKKKVKSDYNDVALRKYELSKLKYYFAIVTCDSAATADYMCEHIDGLEYHSSSMAFDLSLVPDDIDFSDRKVKDKCSELSINEYRPPSDFTVNALQHTNVECSWDAGEKRREKKLTQISQWRKLQESDFQQYLASDDSEDEEEDTADSARAAKAKQFRKALLGGSDDDSDGDGDADDFFLSEKTENSTSMGKKDDEEEDQCMSYSYVPAERDEDKEAGGDNKPMSKRAKKEAKRLQKLKEEEAARAVAAEKQKQGSLALLLADDLADGVEPSSKHEYDMHAIRKAERKKDRKGDKKKGKKSQQDDEEEADAFSINTNDDRFTSLVSSSKFAIDPTSTEYKSTPAMKKILKEQQQRLIEQQIAEDRNSSSRGSSKRSAEESGMNIDGDDDDAAIDSGKKLKGSDNTAMALADKIKQKFANQQQKSKSKKK